MTWLAVLVPSDGPPPPSPAALPLARAALALASEGVRVVFGDGVRAGRVSGSTPTARGWDSVRDADVAAVWDRYPGQSRPDAWRRLLAALGPVPVANPPAFDDLCRDKLACQRALPDAGFPPVEDDPARFPGALGAWGAGFLKPRYGSFGRGVSRVVPGDGLPAEVVGLTGAPEPALLQRAVAPPPGYAGVSVRVHVHRGPGGAFRAGEPVARWSRTDPVVNAARGAGVTPLRDAFPAAVDPCVERSESIARALAVGPAADRIVELGVDLVLDGAGRPWPVEVNGKPRGRLEALARGDPRWQAAHEALAAGPLRWLAARFGGGA